MPGPEVAGASPPGLVCPSGGRRPATAERQYRPSSGVPSEHSGTPVTLGGGPLSGAAPCAGLLLAGCKGCWEPTGRRHMLGGAGQASTSGRPPGALPWGAPAPFTACTEGQSAAPWGGPLGPRPAAGEGPGQGEPSEGLHQPRPAPCSRGLLAGGRVSGLRSSRRGWGCGRSGTESSDFGLDRGVLWAPQVFWARAPRHTLRAGGWWCGCPRQDGGEGAAVPSGPAWSCQALPQDPSQGLGAGRTKMAPPGLGLPGQVPGDRPPKVRNVVGLGHGAALEGSWDPRGGEPL